MKISIDPTFEETAKMREYLEKEVTIKYHSNGTLFEKTGVLESLAQTTLTIRTKDRTVVSVPYKLGIELENR